MSFLVFDLETVPDKAWSPAPDKPDDFPPPWACRVVVAAFAQISYEFSLISCGTFVGFDKTPNDTEEHRETNLLRSLHEGIERMKPAERTLVTYNGRGFDIPVLVARSMRHVVPMSWWLANENTRKRYAIKSHIDLCDQFSEYGAARKSKLDELAKSIGLPGKTDVRGSDVARLIAEGKLEEVRRYALDDVEQTAVLLLRFVALRGKIKTQSGQSYASAVLGLQERLLAAFRAKRAAKPAAVAAPASTPRTDLTPLEAAVDAAYQRAANRGTAAPASDEEDFG